MPWCFNRKEAKDHGEGGLIVGAPLAGRVLVVDDVITAGTAIREVVEIVAGAGAEVAAIVVAIDRQERGPATLSAVQQVEQELGVRVRAIVTLDDVVAYLEETGRHAEHLDAVRAYRDEHGVQRRVTDEVGVGPWEGTWPDDDRLDPELLEHGDRRNVVDQYRYWTVEAIVADLDTRRHPLHVAIENWQHDSNIGSIVRTANAFNVAAVHVVGKRRWNRRGAMVTDRYQHIEHHPTSPTSSPGRRTRACRWSASTTCRRRSRSRRPQLPAAAVMVFGQEGPGLTPEALAACTGHSPSPSSARPARSTPVRPPPSPCTPGCVSTPTEDGLDGAQFSD